jgi:hypothetical protein
MTDAATQNANASADAGKAAAAVAGANGAEANASWYAPLKPDADTLKIITDHGIADINTFGKMFRDTSNLARSRNVWEKPDPKKPLTEWKPLTELGWNPDPAKYALADPKEVKEGIVVDKAVQLMVAKAAHKHGIPLPMAQGLYEELFNGFSEQIAAQAAKRAKDEADLAAGLDKEWGADKPRKTELSRRAMRYLGLGAEDANELEKILGAPKLVRLFNKIGDLIGEDKLVGGDIAGGGGLPESAAAIEAELNRLEADDKFVAALKNERHPQHNDFTAQRAALIAKLAALRKQKR